MTSKPDRPLTGGRLLLGVFRRQRRRVLLGASFWAGHQTCEALVPVAIGLSIDYAVAPSNGVGMLLAALGTFVLFAALTTCWRSGAWVLTRAVQQEAHGLRLQAVRRVLSGSGIETERGSGELLSITTSDATQAAEVLESGSWVVAALVGLAVSAFLLLRIDWVLGLGVLVAVPLLVLALNALGPFVERRTANQQQAVGLAAGVATDLLGGLRPLRGFGGVPEAVRRYAGASQTSLRAQVGALRAEAAFVGATTFTSGVLLAVVAGVAGWFALSGRISVGELITVVGLAAFVADPVQNMSQSVFVLSVARASAARLAEVLTAPVRAAAGHHTVAAGLLELDGVAARGLPELTLRVEPGELVGVVVPDPVAAETLSGLLTGSTTPVRGTVTLGADALVEPHTVELFGRSLAEALDVGAEQHPEQGPEQRAAALAAAAVGELGEDLERPLLDHGMNLSGGQRQRIALARALLADRRVLVLRDPTTAVDAVTENVIADGIRRVRHGEPDGPRSTVLLTTSPPLLAVCDRVTFVGREAVVEGTHASLLELPDYAAAVLR